MPSALPELYIAADVEADGPIPGPYSMLSLGMSVVDQPELCFYTELRPISDQVVPEALAVAGLDRDRVLRGTGLRLSRAAGDHVEERGQRRCHRLGGGRIGGNRCRHLPPLRGTGASLTGRRRGRLRPQRALREEGCAAIARTCRLPFQARSSSCPSTSRPSNVWRGLPASR